MRMKNEPAGARDELEKGSFHTDEVRSDAQDAFSGLLEAVEEEQGSADWVIVVCFRGFLETFREHMESLYPTELEILLENMEDMLEAWICPFAGIQGMDQGEGYRRNSELFVFIWELLGEMLEEAHSLREEMESEVEEPAGEYTEENLLGSEALPPWERRALTFYHGLDAGERGI